MELSVNCKKVVEVELPSCPSQILIDIGLEANTDYEIIVEDKFNIKTRFITTSDNEGKVLLVVPEPAIFNEHAGAFEFSIFKVVDEGCNTPVNICDVQEDVIIRWLFRKYEGEIPEAIVKCVCDE